ncbi:uncharacterized protein LOC130737543 isoform X6 [Lotus japonicus]|uniref:uncharacterized protein LOC130737543 isoform X6 n=1 Tax=Lotus japonicus TaxID=34305 RepID=UPI00258D6F07|nr:uncharacterized protein LOC130737543 isoform X6 [Lotus japonicus]
MTRRRVTAEERAAGRGTRGRRSATTMEGAGTGLSRHSVVMRNDDDSIMKMKAAEEALKEKQKAQQGEVAMVANLADPGYALELSTAVPSVGLNCRDSMGTEFETIEGRITSMLSQLQSECGILHRMVYKNKNQHRRCGYFQRLLKVRRDMRLLQSANLEELVTSCFLVIKGERPKQKVHLLESLKRRKCYGEKHNFLERLLGAARLLSEMAEPILKAATEISVLFARSFFMGFSVTVMALLARLRVLVQQILLDVVSLFNMVSSLSRKKQSIKISHERVEINLYYLRQSISGRVKIKVRTLVEFSLFKHLVSTILVSSLFLGMINLSLRELKQTLLPEKMSRT